MNIQSFEDKLKALATAAEVDFEKVLVYFHLKADTLLADAKTDAAGMKTHIEGAASTEAAKVEAEVEADAVAEVKPCLSLIQMTR